ncbi:unnamed protein product, partial [Didymodactylos carnosus]
MTMVVELLDLPTEILERILFYVVILPCENDVNDFLSVTSTCKKLFGFSNDERIWKLLSKRRCPDDKNESETWFERCTQVYWTRTLAPKDLIENVSLFDHNYYCTIQKIELTPYLIRLYIDERGDNSF